MIETDGLSYAPLENKLSSADNPSSHVSINDIKQIISRDYPRTRSSEKTYKLEPYVRNSSDTLMYIINLGDREGWKIYSSDKRTPPILAEGEHGYFSIEEGNPVVKLWISCMADDMDRIKKSTDSQLTFDDSVIKSNKAFWTEEQLRISDGPIITVGNPVGHWEETVSAETVIYDSLCHLVPKWDQNHPYNECSPYYKTEPTKRALTGCVAIAGAQVLYYLHHKIHVPAQMYSDCICTGDIDNYFRDFYCPSLTIWNEMNSSYQPSSTTMLPEAILIGYVGSMVNMHYHDGNNKYSWAIPANLKTNLFEYYGINCTHESYDETIVKESLEKQMPVIVSASDLLIPLDGDIHCFVIDGYLRTKTKYTHNFHFVLDEPPGGLYVMPEDYTTHSYSSPEITAIKINWGWWNQWTNPPVNDGWYTLTGSWTVHNGGTYDYNHYRKMIHGFSIAAY